MAHGVRPSQSQKPANQFIFLRSPGPSAGVAGLQTRGMSVLWSESSLVIYLIQRSLCSGLGWGNWQSQEIQNWSVPESVCMFHAPLWAASQAGDAPSSVRWPLRVEGFPGELGRARQPQVTLPSVRSSRPLDGEVVLPQGRPSLACHCPPLSARTLPGWAG